MSQIWAEVVSIGSELVLGQIIDTNGAYIARALAEIGVGLAYQTTVGDDRDRMREVLDRALDRCRIVITTGGIGPTEDDLTRQVAAEIMGRELVFREDLLAWIEGLFARMNYRMPANNRRQAYVPEGATVIHNPRGTAPAFLCEKGERVLICLPGVPQETEPLIREQVLPYLSRRYDLGGRVMVNRVFKISGAGESTVDAQIKDVIQALTNPVIGIQASQGEIKIRLTAQAESREQAEALLDEGEVLIRERVGDLIFGMGDETLPGNAAAILQARGLNLAVGEALTNGMVTSELGAELNLGRLRGGLVLGRPATASGLIGQLRHEFGADVNLAVAGSPDDEGQLQVEVLVQGPGGLERERTLQLGGPQPMVRRRAAVIAMLTLWQFLRDLPEDM
ncbi:MAG: CinA family nicotinamide mononucleotide deamidase-related protein [Proteobacteria bacterium]|nr:CinA family nicotinamide mononucleotide deamidase-related protein [Pseudomonadota bacterium]